MPKDSERIFTHRFLLVDELLVDGVGREQVFQFAEPQEPFSLPVSLAIDPQPVGELGVRHIRIDGTPGGLGFSGGAQHHRTSHDGDVVEDFLTDLRVGTQMYIVS